MARPTVPLLFALLVTGSSCNVIRQEHSATSIADTVVVDPSATATPRQSLTVRREEPAETLTHFDKIGDVTCNLETQRDNGVRICGRFHCVHAAWPRTHWLDLIIQNEQGDQRTVKIAGVSLSGFSADLAYAVGRQSALFGNGYVESLGTASWSIPAGTDRECKLSVVVEHAMPGGQAYRDTFVWRVRVRGC